MKGMKLTTDRMTVVVLSDAQVEDALMHLEIERQAAEREGDNECARVISGHMETLAPTWRALREGRMLKPTGV